MRYVRPFTADHEWLLDPIEEAGCAVRLVRGTGDGALRSIEGERFALVLEGAVTLTTSGTSAVAKVGDLIFVPAGVPAGISGPSGSRWAEIDAPVSGPADGNARAQIIAVDQARFQGKGFAYQSLADRGTGARTMRINALQVEPGSGSPDFHIHAFAQIYLIQEGEMTLDVGCARLTAPAGTLVVLPAGVVHRNFNASERVERHVSLLVPEPAPDQIFDYAVTIHDREAELLTAIPAARG